MGEVTDSRSADNRLVSERRVLEDAGEDEVHEPVLLDGQHLLHDVALRALRELVDVPFVLAHRLNGGKHGLEGDLPAPPLED